MPYRNLHQPKNKNFPLTQIHLKLNQTNFQHFIYNEEGKNKMLVTLKRVQTQVNYNISKEHPKQFHI